MAAGKERIREVVETYLDLVSRGSAAEIVALYADGATVEDPVGADPLVGRDAILGFYGGLEGLERKARLLALRIAGGEAAFHFEMVTTVGTTSYTLAPLEVMTFDDDGKIASMRAWWGD